MGHRRNKAGGAVLSQFSMIDTDDAYQEKGLDHDDDGGGSDGVDGDCGGGSDGVDDYCGGGNDGVDADCGGGILISTMIMVVIMIIQW